MNQKDEYAITLKDIENLVKKLESLKQEGRQLSANNYRKTLELYGRIMAAMESHLEEDEDNAKFSLLN